jgi:hypothetical protein
VVRGILKILEAVTIDSSGCSFKKSFACCIRVMRSEVLFGVAMVTESVKAGLSKW